MVTQPDVPTKALTDNELLMGLEARARELWEEAWSLGEPVHQSSASHVFDRGVGRPWRHMVTVTYMPAESWRYLYTPDPFSLAMVCEDRDAALAAIAMFRQSAVAPLPEWMVAR